VRTTEIRDFPDLSPIHVQHDRLDGPASSGEAANGAPICNLFCYECKLSQENDMLADWREPNEEAAPSSGRGSVAHRMSGTIIHFDFEVNIFEWAGVP
jgi:hypothetical protein